MGAIRFKPVKYSVKQIFNKNYVKDRINLITASPAMGPSNRIQGRDTHLRVVIQELRLPKATQAGHHLKDTPEDHPRKDTQEAHHPQDIREVHRLQRSEPIPTVNQVKALPSLIEPV